MDIDLESCYRSDKQNSDTFLPVETPRGDEENLCIDVSRHNSSRSFCSIPSNSSNPAVAPRDTLDYGMLVWSVADSGEGMSAIGCTSIYGDFGQFNPADLQVRRIIRKFFVDSSSTSLPMISPSSLPHSGSRSGLS